MGSTGYKKWSRIERDIEIREREGSGLILGFLVLITLWPRGPHLAQNIGEEAGSGGREGSRKDKAMMASI